MSRKRVFMLVLGIAAVVFLAWAAYLYSIRRQASAQRHHLFCEVIQPGMSKTQVLEILRQAGDVRFNGSMEPDPRDDTWHVVFLDPAKNRTYGGVDVEFWHGQYDLAGVRGFDTFDVICDFIAAVQTTESTATP